MSKKEARLQSAPIILGLTQWTRFRAVFGSESRNELRFLREYPLNFDGEANFAEVLVDLKH